VKDDDVAHMYTLSCNRPIGLVKSRHDKTAEVLREFVGRLGSLTSSCEGRYSRLALRTTNRPRHAGTSIATCALAPAMFSPMSRSSILSLLRTCVPQLTPLATLQLFGTLTSAGTANRTMSAAGMLSARYPLKPWGASAPVRCMPLRSHPRCISPARASACRLPRQRVPPAISGAVPLPVQHAYGCCWPGWILFWRAPCHPGDSALRRLLRMRHGFVCAALVLPFWSFLLRVLAMLRLLAAWLLVPCSCIVVDLCSKMTICPFVLACC
jgi:hypothetical protein